MKAGRRGRLSGEFLAYIGEHFGRRRTELIAAHVERSPAAVRTYAAGLFKPRTGLWLATEYDLLRRALGRADLADIAVYLGRPEEAVRASVSALAGRARGTAPLTRDEINDLRARYGRMTDEEVAAAFQRVPSVIEAVVKEYRLRKDKRWRAGFGEKTTMPRWTDAEIVRLKQLYPTRGAVEVARLMDRSVKSVMSKANRLGLGKTQERLTTMGRENVRFRRR